MTKRPRKPAVHPDEASLFRDSVRDVTPLPRPDKFEIERALPFPAPSRRLHGGREALNHSPGGEVPWDATTESGEELAYARNGIGAQTLRKLRRGHWHIQGELDLHGLTVEEAREQLADFLRQCTRRGLRCVRIIHGKGLRSKNREPVLRPRVAGWLMGRDEILAFCQARRDDGGSGAVVVLLQGGKQKAGA